MRVSAILLALAVTTVLAAGFFAGQSVSRSHREPRFIQSGCWVVYASHLMARPTLSYPAEIPNGLRVELDIAYPMEVDASLIRHSLKLPAATSYRVALRARAKHPQPIRVSLFPQGAASAANAAEILALTEEWQSFAITLAPVPAPSGSYHLHFFIGANPAGQVIEIEPVVPDIMPEETRSP